MDLPVSYFSKVFHSWEKDYNKKEKECLAVVDALENFRPYLYGRKFLLSCDHEPMRWINSAKSPTGRIEKWLWKLGDFDYQFECKPGKINKWLPAISANPVVGSSSTDPSNHDSNDRTKTALPKPLPMSGL